MIMLNMKYLERIWRCDIQIFRHSSQLVDAGLHIDKGEEEQLCGAKE